MATWTTTADETLNGIITYTEWNALLGASGNLQYLYDKGLRYLGGDTTERTTNSSTVGDMSTVTIASQATTQPLLVRFQYRKSTGGGGSVAALLGLKINGGSELITNQFAITAVTDQQEHGTCEIVIPVQTNANMLQAATIHAISGANNASVGVVYSGKINNNLPAAAITSITLTGKITSGSAVTFGIDEVAVYAIGVS